ncbi:MAG: CPCC family cysteine-rich protein [Pseudomonadota bacterium]
MSQLLPCRCCGSFTISAYDAFEICPVCGWEDDDVQAEDPTFSGGANVPSLNEARASYAAFGACEARLMKTVRPPREDELPNE